MFRSKDVSKWTETFKDVVTANYLVHVLHCPEGHLNLVSLHDWHQDVEKLLPYVGLDVH